MIVVDSSVWVDYFNGIATRETDFLDSLLGREPVAIGDLILTEVLQDFRSDSDYEQAKSLLTGLPVMEMLGQDLAVRTAENYRKMRRRGITVRKTSDCIIATFCIERQFSLLYCDRGFDPFVKSLGLTTPLHGD